MAKKTRKIIFWVFFSVFLVLATFIPLYQAGYRIDKKFNIAQVGGIFIALPVSQNGVLIYLDGKLKKETGFLRPSFFASDLRPKKYSILVAKDGFWPWIKELEVKENMVTEAKPFLIPKEISGNVMAPDQFDMAGAFPKSSGDKKTDYKNKVEIRQEKGEIIARWKKGPPLPYYFSEEEQVILKTKNEIKRIDFYPRRSDLILIALRNGIFAIELDGRLPRNFQPIYKGFDPDFSLIENKLYIRDQNAIFEIKL